MKKKTVKDFIPKVAQRTGHSEEEVADILDFLFNNINDYLRKPNGALFIKGLGTFHPKMVATEKALYRLKDKIEKWNLTEGGILDKRYQDEIEYLELAKESAVKHTPKFRQKYFEKQQTEFLELQASRKNLSSTTPEIGGEIRVGTDCAETEINGI